MNYKNGRKAQKKDRVFIDTPNGLKVGTVTELNPKQGVLGVVCDHRELEVHPAQCNTVEDHNAGRIDAPAPSPKPTEGDLELE